MTLRELRYLIALADRAHFGRAAEDCHISQPTLSTQIRKLEEYLGLTLIERNAKSFAFTGIGQEVVEKARVVLLDHAQRGRYTDWLRKSLPTLKTTWAIDVDDSKAAAEAFARGQRALGEGDAHKAMGELARACRFHSDHPDYEANLAWARFRVQVASGRPSQEVAKVERELVESVVLGRRPWPRALVALALLCAAGGDADSARWHLAIALSIDPNVPAAAQLAHRLGLRR